MDNLQRMKELLKILNQYSYEYYTLGQPTVSDQTYDTLYDELITLEEQSNTILSNSLTQKVGNIVLDSLTKSTHDYPLLSLDKVKEKDTNKLMSFISKRPQVVMMLKLDGLTVDLTYDKGQLVKAETRGDGYIGEDITHNIKQFNNVPLTISCTERLHVIGEAIITEDTLEDINSKLPLNKRYANCRNLISGTVRQLDSSICKSRKPMFISYIIKGENINITTKLEQLEFLSDNGFDVVDNLYIKDNVEETNLKEYIESLKETARQKRIPIDGLVFMYNDIKYGESLGVTTHHPLHSLAFKFQEEESFTKLIDISWQVGRTGVITPVAIFEPIELCDTVVSQASVHNLSILKSLQLGIGDNIGVIKANEIIPQVKDNLTKSNTLVTPSKCPVCGQEVVIRKDMQSEFLYCPNLSCKGKLVQSIKHYCSRNAMNIQGLSEKTIEKFVDKGFIKNIVDLYFLSNYKKEIISMEGFGVKSYEKLIKSIEKSRYCKMENFIFALGIPNIGLSTAKDLVKNLIRNLSSIEQSVDLYTNIAIGKKKDFLKIEGIGDTMAQSIVDYFNDKDNFQQFSNMNNGILHFEEEDIKPTNNTNPNPLNGKIVYPTGSFTIAKKAELKGLLEGLGAIFANGYKKSLDYLICGNDMSKSSKDKKAIADGVTIMTEEELKDIIAK